MCSALKRQKTPGRESWKIITTLLNQTNNLARICNFENFSAPKHLSNIFYQFHFALYNM